METPGNSVMNSKRFKATALLNALVFVAMLVASIAVALFPELSILEDGAQQIADNLFQIIIAITVVAYSGYTITDVFGMVLSGKMPLAEAISVLLKGPDTPEDGEPQG